MRHVLLSLLLLRRLLTACALLAWLPLAHAQDHITGRAWLEDVSGQMTLAQAQQQPTRPFTGVLNRGYGAGALWLRLHIDPLAGAQAAGLAALPQALAQTLVLRIRPVYLDEITVFDPLAASGVAGVLGDRHHPRLDALQGTDFLLPIARGSVPRDIWLRLATTSTRQIDVQALDFNTLSARTTRQNLVASLYIGVVAVLLVWGIASRLLQREGVMGAFALMQLVAGLYGLGVLGVLRAFWPLAWGAALLDGLGSVFAVAAVAGALWFHVRFLREFRPARWALGALRGMLAWSLLNLVLLGAGQLAWALRGNMLLVLLAPPVCLACAMTGRAWQEPRAGSAPAISRPVLVAFYVLLLAIFALASTTGLGLVHATPWTIYISQAHGLVNSVLLMLMLQYRSFVRNRQRQQAEFALEVARIQVQYEREAREEQEKLLLMLAHEIKTPLATMHLRLDGQARGAHEIRKAMREMDAVIERCLQTVKMDGGGLRPDLREQDLVQVMQDALASCPQPARVQLQAPASLPVTTDGQLVFIVLSNLLDNACDYSAPDSPIVLSAGARPGGGPPAVRLAVANLPGRAGWPDGAQVFDKYYRAPQAQRQSGTGLGLYLAHNLAQALGGELAYEPSGEQIRFVLTLPCRPPGQA